MRRIILLVTAALLMTVFAGVANAQPAAEQSPVGQPGEPGAHTHRVQTGNGGCVDIDSVYFEREDRGLHRGGNASGAHGPAHGPCP